jgi:CRISPR-associated protein Cmr4
MSESKKVAAARSYWIHCLSPLHVGAGRGVGFVDLPVMREKVTNWPFVPGSTVKGVLADFYGVTDEIRKADGEAPKESRMKALAFGRAGDESSFAGALVFSDARIVALPVRSLYGTFAWVSSPLVLGRLARDLEATQEGLFAGREILQAVPSPARGDILLPRSDQGTGSVLAESGKVFLEDLDFGAREDETAGNIAEALAAAVFEDAQWRKSFLERFALVSDEIFGFLSEVGTQVDARIRIDDEKKIVENGALWYEESLPAETILSGLAWADGPFGPQARGTTGTELLDAFCSGRKNLQIGGKATVGRGRVVLAFR